MDLELCLKALGDPTRLRIFRLLLTRRNCTRSLSGQLGITEAAVSQYLKVLREAGLVSREKYGYHTHYLPAPEALDFLAEAFEGMRQAARAPREERPPCHCDLSREEDPEKEPLWIKKPATVLRLAVPCREGQVFPHFGRAQQFRLYDTKEGRVLETFTADTGGYSRSALADYLALQQADVLLCGQIGEGAKAALAETGIRLYFGYEGDADAAVTAFLGGASFRPDGAGEGPRQ